MKVLEKILAIGIVVGLIMKFTLTSGGDVIVLFTTLTLASLYYAFGFLFFNQIRLRNIFKKDVYKNVPTVRIVLAVVTGLGLSTVLIGSLFKILSLTGADQMLLIGLFITAAMLITSLTLFIKEKNKNSKFILWRVGVIGFIGFSLIMTPNLSILELQYRNHPNYIEAYRDYLADPQNEELYKKVELERNRIRLTDEEFKQYEKSNK